MKSKQIINSSADSTNLMTHERTKQGISLANRATRYSQILNKSGEFSKKSERNSTSDCKLHLYQAIVKNKESLINIKSSHVDTFKNLLYVDNTNIIMLDPFAEVDSPMSSRNNLENGKSVIKLSNNKDQALKTNSSYDTSLDK